MIAIDAGRGHDERMASWPRGVGAAGWGLAAFLVAVAAAVAIALGLAHPDPGFPSAALTQSTTWVVVMMPSLAAALGITLWTARRAVARGRRDVDADPGRRAAAVS